MKNEKYRNIETGEEITLYKLGKRWFEEAWNKSKEAGFEPDIYVGECPKLDKTEYIEHGYILVTEHERDEWELVTK